MLIIPRREINMKWIKLMLITAIAVMVVGCDSSKGTVNIPYPYTEFIVRFQSLYENDTPAYDLFGTVKVTNNKTGEYIEVFNDEELKDFFDKDSDYEIIWRVRESGQNPITCKHPSFSVTCSPTKPM
jgi:hypothetical protein